ncbi:hypothetical protein V5F77_18890 [Xanthobacter sp. DSM 24535]
MTHLPIPVWSAPTRAAPKAPMAARGCLRGAGGAMGLSVPDAMQKEHSRS